MANYLFTSFFKLFGFYRSPLWLQTYWPTVVGLILTMPTTALAAVPKFDAQGLIVQLDWAGAGFIIIALWFIDTILGFLKGWMRNQVDEHRLQQGIGKLVLWFSVIGLCMIIRLSGARWLIFGMNGSELVASTIEILVAATEGLSIFRTICDLSGNPVLQKWGQKLADKYEGVIDARVVAQITQNQTEEIKEAIKEQQQQPVVILADTIQNPQNNG